MAVSNLVSTPSGYSVIKFGNAIIQSGSTYVDVSISGLPSNYEVVLTPTGSIPSEMTLFTTDKTTSGFRINTLSAPTSDVTVSYIVIG